MRKKPTRVRKFLKKMPPILFRGTTLDRVSYDLNGWTHFFHTNKDAFKGKTRDWVSRFYHSLDISVGYALGYGNVRTLVDERHYLHFSQPTKLPVVLLVEAPKKWLHYEGSNHKDRETLGDNYQKVRGSREKYALPIAEGVSLHGMKGIPIELTAKDFRDCENAWKTERDQKLKRHPVHLDWNISAQIFAMRFLVRRVARKAIPFVRKSAK